MVSLSTFNECFYQDSQKDKKQTFFTYGQINPVINFWWMSSCSDANNCITCCILVHEFTVSHRWTNINSYCKAGNIQMQEIFAGFANLTLHFWCGSYATVGKGLCSLQFCEFAQGKKSWKFNVTIFSCFTVIFSWWSYTNKTKGTILAPDHNTAILHIGIMKIICKFCHFP